MAEWKKIAFATYVMKVPAGMIIARDQSTSHATGDVAMVFVPDPTKQMYAAGTQLVTTENLIDKWIEENTVT